MSLETALVDRVLDLPESDRAELARRIILSLESSKIDVDAEATWADEVEQRLAAVDRGEIELRDWRESTDRIRASLRRDTGP